MGFWTDATLQDPKRAYRFLVTLGTMENGAQWYAKSVTKPSFKIGTTEHNGMRRLLRSQVLLLVLRSINS